MPLTEQSVDSYEGRTGSPVVVDLAALDPVRRPCGWARRAFADVPDAPASVHRVEIEADARAHYHRDHTEIDYVLECAAGAAVELDGERVAVGPGSAVLDPAGGAAPGGGADDDPERRGAAVRPGRRAVRPRTGRPLFGIPRDGGYGAVRPA